MKAVVLTGYGDVDKLELRDVPDPKAERGTIVVRMAGGSINRIDWVIRSGAAKGRFPIQFPAILGRDVAGEVIEVGAEVDAFAVGDRVLGVVSQGYAERVAGPADAWAKLPAGLDVVDAGALPLILATGAQLAEEAVRPALGDVVLITGAGGERGARGAVRRAREGGEGLGRRLEVATRGRCPARSRRGRRARRRGGLEQAPRTRCDRGHRRRRDDREALRQAEARRRDRERPRRTRGREGARLYRARIQRAA
jgi:hypothetical protein